MSVLRLEGADNKEFNQKIFDRSVKGYLSQIAAKEIYYGNIPNDEKRKEQMGENMWAGENISSGFSRAGDSPIGMYAFKNNGKNTYLIFNQILQQGIFILWS